MKAFPDLVVFDLAGTTVRDAGAIAGVLTSVLHRFDLGNAIDIDSMRGASKREMIEAAILRSGKSGVRPEDVMAAFRHELLDRFAATEIVAIEGAEDVFAAMKAAGSRVALTSGLDREVMATIVAALKWEPILDATVSADDVTEGRPAPFLIFRAMEKTGTHSTAAVANVGDTVFDLRSGANAGVRWNFGVLTGAHRREALAAEAHTALLGSIRDLPSFFMRAAAGVTP